MDSNRTLWIAILIVTLGVGALLLQPKVEEVLRPRFVGARVGIQVEGSDVAVVGPVELEVGRSFLLHAILEAEDRSGEALWYTEAKRVRLPEGEVPSDRLRVWNRRPVLKVRWFTVEGLQPFLEVEAGGNLSRFQLEPFVRSGWPLVWKVPGLVEAAHDDGLRREQAVDRQRFGTQRYLVQFELYDQEGDLLPSRRIRSPGPEELQESPETFPTVRLRLPAPLGPASEVFGLTQIQVEGGEPSPELRRSIDELVRQDLAFTRSSVLRRQILGAGAQPGELDWTTVETGAGVAWGETVRGGDLLRAGDRAVVLWQDRGLEGELDDLDLCFDYVDGASVRTLGEVFVSGEGQLDLARLG